MTGPDGDPALPEGVLAQARGGAPSAGRDSPTQELGERSARSRSSAADAALAESCVPIRSCMPRSFVRYDPSAFRAGDVIFGAWRQTDSEFKRRRRLLRLTRQRREPADTGSADGGSVGGRNGPARPGDDAGATTEGARPKSRPPKVPWHRMGIRSRHPALHAWLRRRIGTRETVCLVSCFAALEVARFVLSEHAYVRSVNSQSVDAMADLLSFSVAFVTSFLLEGTEASGKVFAWRPMWRFMGVAILFALANALTLFALRVGATTAQVVTVGYVYMPVSAVLSFYVFRRRYGRLEWLAMGMLTLAISAFVFLREQSKGKTILEIQQIRSEYSLPGLFLILCSVAASVMASILAERIFKDRSKGLKWWSARFYVMKVHLDFGQAVVSCMVWFLPFIIKTPSFLSVCQQALPINGDWFGAWDSRQVLMVCVLTAHGWLAGLLVKEFSTVVRALVQSVTMVLVMAVEDPILDNRYNFTARKVPTAVLTTIIILCAAIFQTGRLNLQDVRVAAELERHASNVSQTEEPEAKGEEEVAVSCHSQSMLGESSYGSGSRSGASLSTLADESSDDLPDDASIDKRPPGACRLSFLVPDCCRKHLTVRSMRALLAMYSLLLVYTLSDVARNLVLQRAMASTRINSNSMGLMQYVCGVVFASCLTVKTHGWAGLREALSVRKVLKCTPAGLLFAVQATLMNMAYSQGIDAALALVLGRVYIPVAAVGARCVLGKFYMWLEYAAIGILTLATVAFGYLKAFDVATGAPRVDHLAAMLLVIASASVAALNSLITERLLKGETVPFHLQKIRLDIASTLSSLALLPILGCITDRAQDIPWVPRPTSRACEDTVCWDVSAGAGASPLCGCDTASGVFAGWTAESMPVILLALVIGVVYNWLVGKLVQRFSTIHRCIADSFSLLAIYFVGDPIFNHTSLDNMCLNLVALIVPLCSGLFVVAASEMQRVMEAIVLLRALSVQGEEPDAAASPGPTAAPESEGVLESPLSEAQQVRISIDGGAAASEGADSTSGAPLRDGADLPSPEPSAGAEKHGETVTRACPRGRAAITDEVGARTRQAALSL